MYEHVRLFYIVCLVVSISILSAEILFSGYVALRGGIPGGCIDK